MAAGLNKKLKRLIGGLAQLGEHLPCKQGVESSNLLVSIVNFLSEIVKKFTLIKNILIS